MKEKKISGFISTRELNQYLKASPDPQFTPVTLEIFKNLDDYRACGRMTIKKVKITITFIN